MSADLDRLLAKAIPEPNSGCLLWMGATNADGYGRFNFGGRAAKKLTPEDVATIKIMVAGGLSQRSVAKAFGVSQHGISFIVRGKRHKHVKGD